MVIRNKDSRKKEYWKELSEDTLNPFFPLGILWFKVRDSNLLGTCSNTWAMPPVCKLIYSHWVAYINVGTESLQLLRGKWWMRATEYGMEGKTLEHSMTPALFLTLCNVIWKCNADLWCVCWGSARPSSNVRNMKMWMNDSVVLLHSLNPSQWGGCAQRLSVGCQSGLFT
jgi:hypothetical protein